MIHVVLPDTQIRPGVPIDHLGWAGQYIVDKHVGRELRIIHIGDHADMASLSSYDARGSKSMEGRRYMADIEAANKGFDLLNAPLKAVQARQRRNKEKIWQPDLHIMLGNHENRIDRAVEQDPRLEGIITTEHLNFKEHGWQVHPFLDVVFLDGIGFSHYYYAPMSGRAYASSIDLRLKTIGHSFTQGHQQTLLYGIRYVAGRSQHGLVAGSFYLHDEEYRGPQGNQSHWRGIIIKYQVEDGSYDPLFVSMDYLCRRYEGVPLKEFVGRKL